MKKITFQLLLMLLFSSLGYAQVLNQPANWPNTSWSITGSYYVSEGLFEANPIINSNFAYDDHEAGNGTNNNLAAVSPVINLTNAYNAGEVFIHLSVAYTYNKQVSDVLAIQYLNASTGTWVNWQVISADTPGIGTDDYCSFTPVNLDLELDISGFTPTQLSGFRYRFYFNDNATWANGFCFSSPTLQSVAPPTCPDISNIVLSNITYSSVKATWTSGGNESAWEIAVQPAGTGTPTGNGTSISTNPYTYNGLSGSTNYEVYIRPDCGGGDYGNWIGPVTFTSSISPPPPISGVNCGGGPSSFLFTEEFDTPGAWTGNINTNGGSWEIPDGATSAGTGPANAYSGSNFMNFEASSAITSGSIVSPPIDLNGATGDIELSFYMYAYGAGMGTLNVGIGTSPTGPFTNVFNWAGQYQTSPLQSWLPVGINISTYANQTIYVQFKQTPTTGSLSYTGDMSIDYMRVEACGLFCYKPTNIAATNITDSSAELSWTINNSESNWEYVVQPVGTGVPTIIGNPMTTMPYVVNGLAPETNYEVYIRAACNNGGYSSWAGPYNFTTRAQTNYVVDCTTGLNNLTYCYGNNDTTLFHFTSSTGMPLNLVFNSGRVENLQDEMIVYDSDGVTQLYNGYGNSGNLAGLSFQSSGPEIYVGINSNATINCSTSGASWVWDMSVSCLTCLNPTASYTIVGDCQTSPNFTVQVHIENMGSATTLHVTDDQGNAPQNTSTPGVLTFGPYNNGSEVVYTLTNTSDAGCTITSPVIEQTNCPSMSVSTNQYTPQQLITDVLINSFCSSATNITYAESASYGTSYHSLGYFYNAYNFPITQGIVLSTGDMTRAPGPNASGTQSDGSASWPGDTDLSIITGEPIINNATTLEFDFVPQIDHISFEYIFASEEYTATWECFFSDVFAFILTDSQGNTTNLAVLPNSNIPVTVVNVHGGLGSCGPANAEYFDSYTVEGSGPINFNGYTVVLTAESDVIPGETYHMKLAIADEGDSAINSAVFLSAYSLNLGFCPPVNNTLCGATELTPIPAEQVGSVGYNAYQIETTYTEANEPSGSCFANPAEGTAWFSFVAPPTGELTINTYLPPTSPGIEFAVYEGNGTDCTDFTTLGDEVACASGVASIALEGGNALNAGETYYIQVNNPGGATSSLGIEVIYGDCIPSTYNTPVINPDCDNNQFYVDVNVTTLGNGTPAITDGTNTWPITSTGIAHIGPFADESSVNLTLEHGADSVCDSYLGNYTYTCPYICIPVTYSTATVMPDCDNEQFYIEVNITDLGNGTPTISDGSNSWPITATGIMQFGPYTDESNISLTITHGIDATCNVSLGNFTYNCPFICQPAAFASATVVPDCTNNRFYVAVDITALGNGTPRITNGFTSWNVTSTGIMQVGPFADESNIILTLVHGIDATCNVPIGNFTYNCPFVCSPATYSSATISPDCNNNEFYVDVAITSLGNGIPTITDGISSWNITSTGIKHIGPFADGSNVTLTLEHGTDATCNATIGNFTYDCPFICQPTTYSTVTVNPDCSSGTFYVAVTITGLGNGTPTLTDGTNSWNINSIGTVLAGPFADMSSVTLAIEHGIDSSCDVTLGTYTYTCPAACTPAAYSSATINPDCGNNQFYVDIDITDLGNGTPVITDGTNTWPVTSTGINQVGPFGNSFNVSLTLEHGVSATCDVVLGNFSYSCSATCQPATFASTNLSPDCNNSQFYVTIDITGLGNGIPAITDGTNTWPVTNVGMMQVGPFANMSNVTLTLKHGTDATCDAVVGNFTYTCPPVCQPATYTSATIYPDCDNDLFYVSLDITSLGNGTPVITDGTSVFPISGTGIIFVGPYPSGGVANLTLLHGTDATCNVDLGSYTYTCPFICFQPNFTLPVVDADCDNNQFYINVNITSLGNGTPSITDGTNTWPVTSLGVYQVGPFAGGSSVTLILQHGIDSNCNANMGTYTYTCPVVCNPPAYTSATIDPDCDNSQFYVDVLVSSFGNGTPSITDGTTTWNVPSLGVNQVGPFTNGSTVALTLEHGASADCDVLLGDFTYTCPVSCEPATTAGAYTQPDCDNDQFFVIVYVTGLGNGTPNITDGTTSWPVTSIGSMLVGPFANGSSTVLTLEHGADASCDATLGVFTYTCPIACEPATYSTAILSADCDNAQFYVNVNITSLGNGTPFITDGTTVWYVTSTGIMQVGPFADASNATLTLEHGTDATCNVDMGSFTYSCPIVCTPVTYSSANVNADCNNSQFFVNINITSLGNGTPVITDGTGTWPITSTGIMSVGPFADASTVTLTIDNGTDAICDVALGNFTYTCPFICQPVVLAGTGASSDCGNDAFYVNLNISDLGNGTPMATDGINVWPLTQVGYNQIGPFPSGVAVTLTILHGIDSSCDFNLGSISFTCPPVNNLLCDALPLTVVNMDNAGTTPGDAYTTAGANAEFSENVPTCFNGTINGSVWFSFVAPASGEVMVTTDFAGGTLGDSEIAVYDATGVVCNDMTTLPAEAGCSQSGGITVPDAAVLYFDGNSNPTLTPGATYYIQVDAAYFTIGGTFGIEVVDLIPTKVAGAEKVNFNYYPNPVNKNVLNLSANQPIYSVEVFNMLGQKVMYLTPETNTYTVDMHSLASGNYLFKVLAGESWQTIKIVKE